MKKNIFIYQINDVQNLVKICKEYTVGINMELYRKTLGKTSSEDLKRSLELAAYFTHSELQPGHQVRSKPTLFCFTFLSFFFFFKILTLRTATNVAFKMKNYKMAMSFGRRLLNLGPRPDVAQHVRKIVLVSNKVLKILMFS